MKVPSINVTETEFEEAVLEMAGLFQWRRHAERRSQIHTESGEERHGTPIKGDQGYPDLTLAHPTHGIIFAELKARGGRLGKGQPEWIGVLAEFDQPGTRVLVELWRPDDWAAIECALRDGFERYRHLYRTRRKVSPGVLH